MVYIASHSQKNQKELARVFANRASWQVGRGKFMVAIDDVESALKITGNKISMKRIKAEAIKAKGTSLASLGHINDGIEHLKNALASA